MYKCLDITTRTRDMTTRTREPFEVLEELECQFIARAAKEASTDAIKETFSYGLPVLTLEGGYIVRKYPDGRTENVRKFEKMPVIPKKKTYRI